MKANNFTNKNNFINKTMADWLTRALQLLEVFKALGGQILHSVINGSVPLRYLRKQLCFRSGWPDLQ